MKQSEQVILKDVITRIISPLDVLDLNWLLSDVEWGIMSRVKMIPGSIVSESAHMAINAA